MEIENNQLAILARHTGSAAPQRGQAENAVSGQAGKTGNHDSVSLTPVAQLLRDAEIRVASEPVVDPGRVSAVRDTIQNGSFEIDPARIADKVVGMELSLSRLQ
jgi:negative regulator of flagellin synthesis FlgM